MSPEVIAALQGESRTAERVTAALAAAEAALGRELGEVLRGDAWAHFEAGVLAAGAEALDAGHPQRFEDAVLAAHPETPLTEEALRFAALHDPQPFEKVLAKLEVPEGEPQWRKTKVWLDKGFTPRASSKVASTSA